MVTVDRGDPTSGDLPCPLHLVRRNGSAIYYFGPWEDDRDVERSAEEIRRKTQMHDLIIALAFIGMVVAPALVAAKSGNDAADESN